MRRFAILAAIFACLLARPVAAIPSYDQLVPGSDLASERAALADAFNRAKQKDVAPSDLRDTVQKLVNAPAFSALSPQEKHAAYILLGAAQYDSKDPAASLATLKIASAMPEATGYDWELRLAAAYDVRDKRDCILSLTELATLAPERLKELVDSGVFAVTNYASESGRRDLEPLLRALFAAHWRPKTIAYTADDLWFNLARLELERNNQASARDAVEAIARPRVLIQIRSDNRFDAIVAANPTRYEVDVASKNYLHELEDAAKAAPDRLDIVIALAEEMIDLNRASDALELVNDILAKAEPENGKQSKFTDYDEQINWLHNTRAHALWVLHRYDASAREMASGAKLNEGGDINVSQAINLADTYNAMARPNDALAAVEKLGTLSPYGQMALQEARACAYSQLHDADNLAKVRAYLDSHVADGVRAYVGAMFCINDLDAAAKGVIAELEHPERRDDLLIYMQDYLDVPLGNSFDADQSRKWVMLKNRSDVRAEIAKVGRIERYSLLSPLY
jgi:hypothetical protein